VGQSPQALPLDGATGLCTSRQRSCGCTMRSRLCRGSASSARRACDTSPRAVPARLRSLPQQGTAGATRPAVPASAVRHCRATSLAPGDYLPAESDSDYLMAVAARLLSATQREISCLLGWVRVELHQGAVRVRGENRRGRRASIQ